MLINFQEYSARQVVGAAVLDLPRLLPRLATAGGWVRVRNRHERLSMGGEPEGVRCEFQGTSGIHACRVFPPLGEWMMARALAQWPIRFASPGAAHDEPEVTFILPIRGTNRVPQLLATVDSILGQEGARVECLVVEQSNAAEVRDALPGFVRYLHLPHPEGDPAWRKCWAYNCGARRAQAPLLVCHDADILVPAGYSRALLDLARHGFEAMHLQRFLFYLGQQDSKAITDRRMLGGAGPDDVRQNWKGGTVAILASAYWRIGGFDERFVDWTGEDIEFHSRCATLKAFSFGSVPFVHLWHPVQPTKHGPERECNLAFFSEVMKVPVQDRIARLRRMRKDGER
jgi:hypothetical protein